MDRVGHARRGMCGAEARAQGKEPPAYPASAEKAHQLLQAWAGGAKG
jgi:hypothetical protein